MVKLQKQNYFLMLLSFLVIICSIIVISSPSKFDFTNNDLIPTVSPEPEPILQTNVPRNSVIKTDQIVAGKIDNSWLFEGQFNIQIKDSSGRVIATTPVKIVEGQDWTVPGLKDFSVKITFKTNSQSGTLVINSDNPSGLPENQKSYSIPVKFIN